MATEEDKTNTGIAGTAIAVGVAAMIAGSAALVGMARSEMDDQSAGTQGYADLSSINALKAEQAEKLQGAKLSIEKARAGTLSALKRDPDQASPWTPKPPPPEATSAALESAVLEGVSGDTGAATSAAVSEAAPADSASAGGVAADSAPAVEGAPAPEVSVAPEAPKVHKKKAPKSE